MLQRHAFSAVRDADRPLSAPGAAQPEALPGPATAARRLAAGLPAAGRPAAQRLLRCEPFQRGARPHALRLVGPSGGSNF